MATYYGWKIVNAVHENRYFDIVVDEEQFSIIRDSLEASGLNVDSMLVELDSPEWSKHVESRRSRRTSIDNGASPEIRNSSHDHWRSPYEPSKELGVLHRVKSARSIIYRTSFYEQASAMNTIIASKTQLCNDILMDLARRTLEGEVRALARAITLVESEDPQAVALLQEMKGNKHLTSL